MTYRVVLARTAQNDLRRIHHFIQGHAPIAAREWLKRARMAAKTLGHSPERCPLAPECKAFDKPIRQMFFGSGNRGTYRILFVVVGKTVNVIHIRHGSRLPLSPPE